eukprot:CAMPEP_0201935566 /NCGR_PEP_ID=MMETSP0903-20130614/35756_1 /ASSEMBLY_ACC=CAM_ASM_000552 /TAXON_ID=420261 /ORGANISM="Thalassiosira antarctica, Strain CCMP982" /LENGTH=69 /DNA_ID=CAMNT_0048476017 /DNA_START=40 /DNA_END=249 /DNA_ORIENTATION=-
MPVMMRGSNKNETMHPPTHQTPPTTPLENCGAASPPESATVVPSRTPQRQDGDVSTVGVSTVISKCGCG